MKLGPQRNYHKGWAAIRHCSNQPARVKVLVGAFNQEKNLVGAFSVNVKTGCGTDGALHSTT